MVNKKIIERLKQHRKKIEKKIMERKKEDNFTTICNEFHSQMIITDLKTKTYIYLMVVDKRLENNSPQLLLCHQGTPINGYVYDAKKDALSISCVASTELGFVNAGIQISVPNCGGWKKQVPLPFDTIIRLLSPQQTRIYKTFQEKYKENNFDMHFIQLLGCN